jgi:ABC-type transporter Mla subunit MlaD
MAQQVTFGAGNPFSTAARWIKVWVALLVAATVIVCLFLVAIISALRAIDRSLATTTPAVDTIRGSTDPLTGHIETINGTLEQIDANLKPIPGQADTIIGSLTSIDGKVASVNSSLSNTSGILITGLGNLKTEDDLLETSDESGPENRGVKTIIAQANTINPILFSAESDTTKIDGHLSLTNGAAHHVRSLCKSSTLPGVGCD